MDRRTMIVGCAAGAVGFSATRAAAKQAPQGSPSSFVADAERGFASTLARRDFAAFPSFISEDAIFIGNEGATQVLRGRRAIAEAWKPYFDAAQPPFSWEPDLVQVIDSGTLAMTSGPVRNPQGALTGRFNSVWRLEPDGRWRVVFDRGSPVCPR
ncbi:MAG: nuclear transport factor 2 family protein [Acidobacteriota bacterium]